MPGLGPLVCSGRNVTDDGTALPCEEPQEKPFSNRGPRKFDCTPFGWYIAYSLWPRVGMWPQDSSPVSDSEGQVFSPVTSQKSEHRASSVGPGRTSTTLLDKVKTQDPEAWERLVRLYGPVVYLWSRRSGLPAEDAADIVQEVFTAVANRVANFRRDRPGDTFRGWLRVITRNKIRDQFRDRKDQPQAVGGTDAQQRWTQLPGPLEQDQDDQQSDVEDILSRRALDLVRPQFEDHTWQAFWRLTVDERTGAEVAEELGMTVQATYQAKYRVLQRIREELNDLPQ